MERTERDPRIWLESEYLSRKKKNSGYSLRAFARFLEIPSGRLSQLLSQKRKFTPKLGEKIAHRLALNPRQTAELIQAIRASRGAVSPAETLPAATYRKIDMDHFESIADPIHYSILSFFETADFGGSSAEISAAFGLTAIEARSALERLCRLGLVERKKGKFRLVAAESRTTSHDVSSAALKRAHKAVLEEAKEAVDEVTLELRDITSMTMAIDPLKLAQAKEKIRAFRRSLSEFLETGERTEVYRINIQLVPVTKKRGKQ